MVLGFGRRSTTKKNPDDDEAIKPSPSLPSLSQRDIPWPADLVDLGSVNEGRQQPLSPDFSATYQSVRGTIPFHRPIRTSNAAKGRPSNKGSTIASLYTSPGPPTAFSNRHSIQSAAPRNQRRPRVPPTFNLMVVGGIGTGKSSLLRLFLDTCEISPGANADQRAAVEHFVHASVKSTKSLQTACIEIADTKFDRALLTVIDTPGLDFAPGAELNLERSVAGIVKYLDLQFADTMGEEAKVVRQNKGDQHVHLCIYLIDPESVVSEAMHRARAAIPRLTRSQTTLRYHREDLSPVTSGESSDDSSDDDDDVGTNETSSKPPNPNRLKLSTAELRVIKRLSVRVNVLPVIARADSLTDEKLANIKKAVRRDLMNAGIGFGIFGRLRRDSVKSTKTASVENNALASPSAEGAPTEEGAIEEEDEDEEERQSRPVIKIKKPRFLSRSRSRKNLREDDDDFIAEAQETPGELPTLARLDISSSLPFGILTPELPRRHRQKKAKANENGHVAEPPSGDEVTEALDAPAAAPAAPRTPERRRSAVPSEAGDLTVPPSPAISFAAQTLPHVAPARQQELRGRFVRKYRWGTIDVLNPQHCDFSALRLAILHTHMKALKSSTRDVLYEKYRTEKLLARRATKNISEDDRKRLLEDLGI